MHGTTVGHGTDDDKGRSYKVGVMKTGCIITRMRRRVKATSLSAEDHVRRNLSKANRP